MAFTKIEVDHIARIEGHGDIALTIKDGKVKECKFMVTEPARLFESMVKGRPFDESPYIASRVCGICSSSHTVTDILAIENAFGVEVTDRTRAIRELLIYGSYLQNHATHLFVFAAPDFLGHKSVFPLADSNRELFNSALDLKAMGNELCTKVGGRSIHPITAVIGGFTSEITPSEYIELADKMDNLVPFALSCVDLFNDFGSVALETTGDLLAMVNQEDVGKGGCSRDVDSLAGLVSTYPVIGSDVARFVAHDGSHYDFSAADYNAEIVETPVDHSAAFLSHTAKGGHTYFTSALARINVSWDGLSEEARFAAAKAGLRPPEWNPFANNIAQAVELVDVLIRCSAICRKLAADEYEGSSVPVEYEVRRGRGVGFTEAPRGALFHDLTIDDRGIVTSANIIPPTSQNIANLEADMKMLAGMLCEQDKSQEDIQLEIEKLIRAYDPCLSCSVH